MYMIYTMASNRVFYTTNGVEIHLFPIQIEIGLKAYIKCILMSPVGMYQKEYILEGDEYQAWGSDDDYIKNYICGKETYLGQPVPSVDASGNPIVYQRPDPVVAIQDDNRSVHNEADIQRIQTLQEQLDEQKKKLETITTLLFKNGAI
jgi:hypothetical protein